MWIREEQNVLAGRLRVKMDPGAPGKSDPLDEGTFRVADQENEGPPGPRVVERHIDLARRFVEAHIDPNGRGRCKHQVLRKLPERDGHGALTSIPHKRMSVERNGP